VMSIIASSISYAIKGALLGLFCGFVTGLIGKAKKNAPQSGAADDKSGRR
jgi:hypothetical protein